jgi:NAD(P)-dependent dehydrogenase (short-subunit alcohol dehydrogenase family)
MGLFADKVVVVTGAGQGIGRNHALRFAAEGAHVVVNDIGVGIESGPDGSGWTRPTDDVDLTLADSVVTEIERAGGGRAVADHSDLSNFAGGRSLIDTALAAFGRVDVLVNNAGTLTIMPIGELDEQRLVQELAVHVVGYLGTIQAAWDPMKAQGGGVIVNTASGFGGGGPGLVAYMAAKSGVFSLTRDVALEGAPHGIRCNSITPAARTRMSIPYWGADQTAGWDADWATTITLFLASSLSEGITGRQLAITPGNVVREVRIEQNELAIDGDWTPELLRDRIHEVLVEVPAGGGLRLPSLLTESAQAPELTELTKAGALTEPAR